MRNARARRRGLTLAACSTAVLVLTSCSSGSTAKPNTATKGSKKFTALPGCADQVASLLGQLTVHVRREPGNFVFSPYRRSGSADSYIVFEQYADDKAFNTHVTAQHTVQFNTELASLVEGRGSVLSWLEPC